MATTSIQLPQTKFELEFNQGSVYGKDEEEAVLRVLANNAPSCGNEVLSFERELAEMTGSSFGIAVGNATQGLEIAARAAISLYNDSHKGGRGDGQPEIVVPSISWISTASAAALAGATVRFADVAEPTLCADVASIKALVTPRTAAVIVVHLFGRPADGLVELAAWLRERGVKLIEDCAHAIGAVDASGSPCGGMGDVGVFSFHQQKNMTTLGEGGMCVTSDSAMRDLMVGFRSLCARSYDPKGKYLSLDAAKHPMEHRYWLMDFADHGSNYRMLDMQAAVGRAQLRKVRGWNTRRAEIALALHAGLSAMHAGLRVADIVGGGKSVHAWHVFHVLVTDAFPLPKEDFMWHLLQDFGIKVWNHYSPMHLSSSFRSRGLGEVGDCPVAEALFEQYVSLPVHPRLTDDAVTYMVESIRSLSRRPHVPRASPCPLLNALLALSQPDPKEGASSAADEVAEAQWEVFHPQVQHAMQSGLFSSSSSVCVARAPGRMDLMGGNDDYTGGLVFECTIAEGTFCAAQVVPGGNITIRNRQLCAEDCTVPAAMLQQTGLGPAELAAYMQKAFPGSRWQLYVVGVLLWLRMRYPEKVLFVSSDQGLALLVWGQVPLNRGVSSSASVEVAAMKAAARAFGIHLAGETLATACQWVENTVCSSACGLMDQMAVTLGSPFMSMQCQPAAIRASPPLPSDLTIFALDSGVSHEISGIEYEAARAAAFMGYKIICDLEGLAVVRDTASGEISRFTDARYHGYLANMSPSVFARRFEQALPVSMTGREYLQLYGCHVDPATALLPDHTYAIRANTKYAVLENNRVTLFSQLLGGCSAVPANGSGLEARAPLYEQLGELMYQSHDAYTECGLGSSATSAIVDIVRGLGPGSGLYGAKITGGGAGGTVAVLGLRSATECFQRSVVEPYAKLQGLLELPYVFVGSSPGADAWGIREVQYVEQ